MAEVPASQPDLPAPALDAWVSQWEYLFKVGKSLQPYVPPAGRVRSNPAADKCCALLSPHPDDECIVGALPLRLLREQGWRVVNIAITHGSKPERQLARAQELAVACECLGFENIVLAERGLQRISGHSRAHDPAHWAVCVNELASHIDRLRPDMIVLPHPHDAQAAHRGTSLLGLDVLKRLPTTYTPWVAYAEFWSTQPSPNLMVQVSPHDLADLIGALMQHKGEISRNPYHLRLPAWMMDNVRRGAEQVGLPGSQAPDFPFATLYRVLRWQGGDLRPAWEGGQFAAIGQPVLGQQMG